MDGDEGRKVESQETTNFPAGPKAKVVVESSSWAVMMNFYWFFSSSKQRYDWQRGIIKINQFWGEQHSWKILIYHMFKNSCQKTISFCGRSRTITYIHLAAGTLGTPSLSSLLEVGHILKKCWRQLKQARKPRSYASLKLRLTDWLTYLLTDEGKV